MLQQHNSQSSFSNCYAQKMNEISEQEWRKKRLTDLSKVKGGNASLGRMLGYRDGAYVGQMIGGLRPITEKLVEKIQQMHGLSNWFTKESTEPVLAHQGPKLEEIRASYGWPFASITEEEWTSIPRHKRDLIEEQIRGILNAQQSNKLAA